MKKIDDAAGVIDDDLDFDAMTDDEVIAYLTRCCDISHEQAVQNWMEARRAVQAATEALFAACAEGEIEATGINVKTGRREVIPPNEFRSSPRLRKRRP